MLYSQGHSSLVWILPNTCKALDSIHRKEKMLNNIENIHCFIFESGDTHEKENQIDEAKEIYYSEVPERLVVPVGGQ
jgi:hypothetical protein